MLSSFFNTSYIIYIFYNLFHVLFLHMIGSYLNSFLYLQLKIYRFLHALINYTTFNVDACLTNNGYHIETMNNGNNEFLFITLAISGKKKTYIGKTSFLCELYQTIIKPIKSYVIINQKFYNSKTYIYIYIYIYVKFEFYKLIFLFCVFFHVCVYIWKHTFPLITISLKKHWSNILKQ